MSISIKDTLQKFNNLLPNRITDIALQGNIHSKRGWGKAWNNLFSACQLSRLDAKNREAWYDYHYWDSLIRVLWTYRILRELNKFSFYNIDENDLRVWSEKQIERARQEVEARRFHEE